MCYTAQVIEQVRKNAPEKNREEEYVHKKS